jgi:hypothetical protein
LLTDEAVHVATTIKKTPMKSILIVSIAFLFFLGGDLYAQSFHKKKSSFILMGVGVTGGATYCTQIWNYTDPPASDTKKYRLGFNGSIFIEMINHPTWRWVSELQYNKKGGIDVTPNGDKFNNGIDYISFNNFLKLREQELTITPYLIAGPRLEYRIASHPQNNPDIINNFKTLHLSFSVGAGVEFLKFNPWLWFVEFQFNPDLTNAFQNPDLRIKHRAFELRIGLKYALQRGEKCPPAAH